MFEGMELTLLFEDDYTVAVHKPAGMLTQATGNPVVGEACAEQVLSRQLGHGVWAVHRLDRATSGLLLLTDDGDLRDLRAFGVAIRLIQTVRARLDDCWLLSLLVNGSSGLAVGPRRKGRRRW